MAARTDTTPQGVPFIARLPHTMTPCQEMRHLNRLILYSMARVAALNKIILLPPEAPSSGLSGGAHDSFTFRRGGGDAA